MKKNITIALIIGTAILTGCASVKDQQGNVVGKCFGLSCAVRSAFDYNHIDPKTGLLEGQIPLFTIKTGSSSSPAETKTVASASAPAETTVLGEAATQQIPQQ